MGGRTSKKPNPSQSTKPYENTFRAYTKWDHHSAGPITHNISCFTTHEINNFKRHNQLTRHSPNEEEMKPSNNFSRKKARFDKNLVHGKRLTIQKSQSVEQLPDSKHLITVQQLIQNQSSFYQNKNTQKSFSTTNLNQIISTKQIPLNLQLVLINQNDLQVNNHQIGKGNFGTVYRALYKGTRDVALKTLKPSNEMKSSIEESNNHIYEFLHEAYIMTHLRHENVLRFLGVSFFGEEKQLSLVTDFMKNGSLLDYLRNNREIFLKLDSNDVTIKLNSFAKQIFQAMLYLEEKSIIHRDLAARNCLIGEDDTLKVADFGLTKLTECGLYKGSSRTKFALRWSSPEAIFSSKYSSRSDVWSYGITIWEIYSLGERPFGNLSNINIRNILKNSSENLSLYLPKSNQFGSDALYTHIILSCLIFNVNLRPRFRDLVDKIYNILNNNKQHM